MHSSGSEYGQVAGSCEHYNETSVSVECWGFQLVASDEGLSSMELAS
jgi:hypothetical protein